MFTNKALKTIAPALSQCLSLELLLMTKNAIAYIEPEFALAIADLLKLNQVM